jgi:hypothetical protein
MDKKYIVREDGYVELLADNLRITIPNDEGNSDYQAYIRWLENPNAENGTIS